MCVRDKKQKRCKQAITDQITDQHPKEEEEEKDEGERTWLERWVAHGYL